METTYKNVVQKWAGFYRGNGNYALQYIPKQAETVNYRLVSHIPGFAQQTGVLVVTNLWPGKRHATDYKLGRHWYTDKSAAAYYDGKIQGGKTVSKWRNKVLLDWAKRLAWLR